MAAAAEKTDQKENENLHPVAYFNQPVPTVNPLSVLDLLQDEQLQQVIVTFSERIDRVLGGGVPLAKVTELCGEPGTGKTQLCLQAAVDVRIPQCFGGVGGECLFVDTEQSFFMERFRRIARSAIAHCEEICDNSDAEQRLALQQFTMDAILNGLHYVKCIDNVHLLTLIENLTDILRTRRSIKLVIVDSLAFPMRIGYEDYSLRTRVLSGLAQRLIQIAATLKLAVVVTNHMTTKLSTDRSWSRLIPALGESWGHVSSTRLLLERDDGDERSRPRRTVTVVKSASSRPMGETVEFAIVDEGVRDVVASTDEERSTVAVVMTSDNDDDVTDSELMEIDAEERQFVVRNRASKAMTMHVATTSFDSGQENCPKNGIIALAGSSPPLKKQKTAKRTDS